MAAIVSHGFGQEEGQTSPAAPSARDVLQPGSAPPRILSEVASPPPSYYGAPSSPISPILPVPGIKSFFSPAQAERVLANPLQIGPFQLHPHASYSLTYATGVNRSPGNPEETLQHVIAPGLTWAAKHVTLDYTPSISFYTKGSFRDSVNHALSAHSSFNYGDWIFSLSYSFATGSSVLAETATQTDFTSHNTSFNALYSLSDKVSFDFSVNQQIHETSQFNDTKTWSTMEWANYQLTHRTTVGVGVGGGYSELEIGSNMTYEQVQARVGWRPGEKLSVNANGGMDIRQFLGPGGAKDKVSPTYGLSAGYHLFENTTFSLSINRSISPSLQNGQISESTSIGGGMSQRLFGRLTLNVNGGYRTLDYHATEVTDTGNRSDETRFVSASLGTSIFKKGSISVSYTHESQISSSDGFGFDSDHYTLRLGYHF